MIKNKIVELTKPRKIKFHIDTIDTPIDKNQLLSQTIYTAISSGTETAAYLGLPAVRKGVKYPRLLGYCNISKILIVGDNLKNKYKLGDIILTLNSHRKFNLIKKESVLLKINLTKLSFLKQYVFLYLFHIGLDSINRLNLKKNDNVLILGLGLLSYLTIEFLKLRKITHSIITNELNYKNNFKFLEHANVIFRNEKNKIKDCNKNFDKVFLFSNSWKDWKLSLLAIKDYGKIGVVGFPGRNQKMPKFNTLDPYYFYQKQIKIYSLGLTSYKYEKKNIEIIYEMIKSKKINAKKYVTDIFQYDQIEKAYKKIIQRNNNCKIVLLKW